MLFPKRKVPWYRALRRSQPELRLKVDNFTQALLDALLPQWCSLCGQASGHTLALCRECENRLAINDAGCPRCALPRANPIKPDALCPACLSEPPAFTRVIAPMIYDENLGQLIHRWKFHREQVLSELLARLWLRHASHLPAVDALVPVPLHWRRLLHRGFNQTELLGGRLRTHLKKNGGAPPMRRLVRRCRADPAQTGLTADQRRRNLDGAFTATGDCTGLRLAVIDDVVTTGSTATAMTRSLLTAGAESVEIWALARTPLKQA